MKAVIQANQPIKGSNQGAMEIVDGKPIIQWQIESLRNNGITNIMVVIPEGSPIKAHLGNGAAFGVRLTYHEEQKYLGSAGAFGYIASKIHEDFVFLFGHFMLDIAWEKLIDFHAKKGGMMTAYIHPIPHPEESDIVLLGQSDLILNILPKNKEKDFYFDNLTLAGVYIVSRDLIETFDGVDDMKMDFEQEVLIPTVCCEGVYGYQGSEYIVNCSSSSKLEQARRDQNRGIIAFKNLKTLQKAIFLDRDGVMNVFGDYVCQAEQLKIKPDVGEAIRLINESGYLAIVITNQPVVARGQTTMAEMFNIHRRMEDLIGAEGAYLDAIYFCPHFPGDRIPGDVKELRIECDCRKPNIGMIKKAQERFNIDLSQSWFIGDHYRDIKTGENAGCRTIHITSGDQDYIGRFEDAKPDYVCANLLEAVKLILNK